MRVAVIGAGGVGGYFGARLLEAGVEVIFLVRGAHLAALERRGLQLRSIAGDVHLERVVATDDPARVASADAVLVATKAWQVAEAAEQIRPHLGPDTLVVGLQNGVEAADDLAAVLGRERVAGGTCALISRVTEPGLIEHTGSDPRIVVGDLNGTTERACARLRDTFEGARGVDAVLSDDIRRPIWRKFVFLASASAVGAATRTPAGVYRELAATRAILRDAMEEVALLAAANGVPLDESAVDKALAFVDGLPPAATTSMQRDVLAGRPSELETLSGAVVRLAGERGVPVPVHRTLHAALVPLELRARGRLQPWHEP